MYVYFGKSWGGWFGVGWIGVYLDGCDGHV
jgi:hypothetical protein